MSKLEQPTIEPSQILLNWMKFPHEEFDWTKPQRIFVNGIIGAGKSAFLEALAEQYLVRGNNVADLYGSSAGEALAWLRSPWVVDHKLSALLIRGDTEISFLDGQSFPVKFWKDVTLEDFEKNRIVISTTPLYNSRDEEYNACNQLMRLFDKRIGYSKFIFALIREAKYLVYARIKFSEGTKSTKASGIDLITQSRHHGLSLGLDAQRSASIDKEIRDLLSYRVFKSMGNMTVSIEDYYFSFWRPPWVARMRPGQFAIISDTGNVGRGYNQFPTWHKRERENLVKALGINIKYSDKPDKKKRKQKEEAADEFEGDSLALA